MALIVIPFLLGGCGWFESTSELREEQARYGEELWIGVAWPFASKNDRFREGIELGLEEINEQGGIDGRPVRILVQDDSGAVNRGRRVAQSFVDDPRILAVIGHYNSYVALPAAKIYQFNDMTFVTPGATNPDLTREDYEYIFRTIPDDDQTGEQVADYFEKSDFQRSVVLYANNSYGRGFADAFTSRARKHGLRVVDRLSYDPDSPEYFEQVIQKWLRYDFDAILLAGSVPSAGEFILRARRNGMTQPVVGGDGLDSDQLYQIAGEYANHTIVAAPFHPEIDRKSVREFNRKFQSKYDHLPDPWAVEGYETIHLLASAMRGVSVPTPQSIAQQLQTMAPRETITGRVAFDANGNITGKSMIFKTMINSEWKYLGSSDPNEAQTRPLDEFESPPTMDSADTVSRTDTAPVGQ